MTNPQLSVILLNFNGALPYIIAFVLLTKVALFVKYRTSQWTLANLIYFNYKHILSVKASERANIKIIENSLSFYVMFLIIINFMLSMYVK